MGLAHLAHVLEVDVADADEPTQPEAAQRAAEVVRDQRGRDVREAVAAAERRRGAQLLKSKFVELVR